MKKFLIILSGFLIGLILFMPKQNIFFLAQKKLAQEKIYINTKTENSLLKLTLKNSSVFYNGMNIANLNKADILLFVVYNKIKLNNLKINIGNYLINNAEITYSIINPLKIYIKAKANFADINGYVYLTKRYLKVYLTKIKDNTIKKLVKKDKKGYFYYVRF